MVDVNLPFLNVAIRDPPLPERGPTLPQRYLNVIKLYLNVTHRDPNVNSTRPKVTQFFLPALFIDPKTILFVICWPENGNGP